MQVNRVQRDTRNIVCEKKAARIKRLNISRAAAKEPNLDPLIATYATTMLCPENPPERAIHERPRTQVPHPNRAAVSPGDVSKSAEREAVRHPLWRLEMS
jgi:hypothetical protein